MSTEQTGRVVFVNGATGGLGPAVVRLFANAGARLVLSARAQAKLEQTSQMLGLAPDKTLLIAANALDSDAVGRVVQVAEEHFGRLDVLVQVTGGFHMQPALETSDEAWSGMIGLNLDAAFFAARAALPGMLKRGSGKVIFVSSRGGSQPAANLVAYGASKAGLEVMVQVLAEETRRHGVNVNAVSPSIIDTPTNRAAMPNANFAAWVTPEAIAEVIFFLASDAARSVHGAIVPVFGEV